MFPVNSIRKNESKEREISRLPGFITAINAYSTKLHVEESLEFSKIYTNSSDLSKATINEQIPISQKHHNQPSISSYNNDSVLQDEGSITFCKNEISLEARQPQQHAYTKYVEDDAYYKDQSTKNNVPLISSPSKNNIHTSSKYYGFKVPAGSKADEKMVVTLPNGQTVGLEYPSTLLNSNNVKVSDGQYLLLVAPNGKPPNISQGSKIEKKSLYGKRSSRIGKLYQVHHLPTVGNICSYNHDLYEQVWNPIVARESEKRIENIDLFLSSVHCAKDVAMTALHLAGYDTNIAEYKLLNLILSQPRKLPCNHEILNKFHTALIKNYKCIRSVGTMSSMLDTASSNRTVTTQLNISPESCILFYYQKYKQTVHYQKFKAFIRTAVVRKEKKDDWNEYCETCQAGGNLLCCDGCEKAYHKECLSPPLDLVPEGDWFCDSCNILSKPKRKLNGVHSAQHHHETTLRRNKRAKS